MNRAFGEQAIAAASRGVSSVFMASGGVATSFKHALRDAQNN